MTSQDRARRLLTIYVVLVAAHSYAVGAFLLFATRWGAAFGGWGDVEPLFFARQAGIFHFVVATGYLVEYFRYGGIAWMLIAKCTAVVFLTAMYLLDNAPWAVPLSALADGLMAVIAWVLLRRTR